MLFTTPRISSSDITSTNSLSSSPLPHGEDRIPKHYYLRPDEWVPNGQKQKMSTPYTEFRQDLPLSCTSGVQHMIWVIWGLNHWVNHFFSLGIQLIELYGSIWSQNSFRANKVQRNFYLGFIEDSFSSSLSHVLKLKESKALTCIVQDCSH